jgi:hypothetical protein
LVYSTHAIKNPSFFKLKRKSPPANAKGLESLGSPNVRQLEPNYQRYEKYL